MNNFNSIPAWGKSQGPMIGLGAPGWVNPDSVIQATNTPTNAITGSNSGTPSFLDSWTTNKGFLGKEAIFGSVDENGVASKGWLDGGLSAANALTKSWLAMQQLDLAKEQFGFQKDAFNKQYENQRTLTNASLSDRQKARLGANPNGYESVGSYMKKNGV